mgnify:CR=1 FL=1
MGSSFRFVVRLAVLSVALGSHAVNIGTAWAQDGGDVSAGRRLASSLCSQCHRIEATFRDASRVPPDFGSIADMASQTEMSLRIFLQTPHGNMPRYQLTGQETDDVIAYLRSLRSR